MAEIPMTDTDQVVLSREEAQAMRQLLAERRQLGAQTNAESAQVPRMRRDAVLPRWNGAPQDFPFFVERLETRIETDYAPYMSEQAICLDMIETLPEASKARVSTWFSRCRERGRFDWRECLGYLKEIFADRQAQQSAAQHVMRMEQGEHQYFADFLQDYEYRTAQCGIGAFTSMGKV
ncbi:hypothetical protein K3495_g1807 [Podosphaera aphanis]|nr:hypothetical protein K3495_g1807 [Podosphaera aphanis]